MNRGHKDTMQIKPRRKPRVNYSVEFKAQIVAQCLLPHVSIASIARTHNLNANVLHRWVREHEKSTALPTLGIPISRPAAPTFIEIDPPLVTVQRSGAVTDGSKLILSLRKSDLSVDIEWPVSHTYECVGQGYMCLPDAYICTASNKLS